MRKSPLILLIATAATVGWIAPGLSAGGAGEETSVTSSSAAKFGADEQIKDRQSGHEAWQSGSTVIERQSDGHFYASALVNSHDTHFLVDTGASIIALTGEDASALGLDWSDDQLSKVGRGASGDVMGVPVSLDSVELGGYEARDVEAVIIPEGLDVSLLGQSFLSQLRGVRIDGDHMVLGG